MTSTSPATPRSTWTPRAACLACALAFVLSAMVPSRVFAESPLALGKAPSPEELDAARAMERGDYVRAQRLADRHDDTPALMVRAQLAYMRQDMSLAGELARQALEAARGDAPWQAAAVLTARMEWAAGERDAAQARLRQVLVRFPLAHAARVELSRLLWQAGQRQEAETLLEALTGYFNNGQLTRPEDMAHLGEAMALLASFDDARYALTNAVQAAPESAGILAARARLFQSKYNASDAEADYARALKLAPRHVPSLLGMARLEMEVSRRFDKARDYLAKVEQQFPQYPELLALQAQLAIYDGRVDDARELAARIVAREPKNLEGMTLVAAVAFLEDDPARFEAELGRIQEWSPGYAEALTETARFGLLVHRYDEAVALYRRALQLRPGFAEALVGLGIGLSRTGQEDEAVEVLREAFEADPYHVRAYNLLEFYTKAMPDMVTEARQGFLLRAHRTEFAGLDRLVTPVVQEALETFTAKYKHTPDTYLAVEVFHDVSNFSVRTVGLPHISPQGICFGRVVAMRSPTEGNFNWRQVLWHELAHVYHLQKGGSRVPRWFTEGLAEYETNVYDPSWMRHHDREIAQAVFDGKVPKILRLDQAFTHAQSVEEIVVAYQVASLAIHYLVESQGFDAITRMLDAFARRENLGRALQSGAGLSTEEFDAGFMTWLDSRYMGFRRQIRVEPITVGAATQGAQAASPASPTDALGWARRAWTQWRQGQHDAVEQAIEKARETSAQDAQASLLLAFLEWERNRARNAHTHAVAVLDLGRDSYDLRLLLARAAMALEQLEEAEVHLSAAHALYPQGAEAWDMRARLASMQPKGAAEEERALWQVFALNQHDASLAARLWRDALARKDHAAGAQAVRRWLDVRPFEVDAHLAHGQLATIFGNVPRADAAWQDALSVQPRYRSETWLRIVALLKDMGQEEQARQWADKAKADGVSPARLRRALEARPGP